MRHPLSFIPRHLRKSLFYFFFAMTIAIFGVFSLLDQPLRTEAAPHGIVSFELAGQVKFAQTIINSWDENARLFTAFGLGLDYLFMPMYAMSLSFGLLLAIGPQKNRYNVFAVWMGWGALVTPFFDALENYMLWRELIGPVVSPYPQIAAICATIKFMLLVAGLVTALSGRLFLK